MTLNVMALSRVGVAQGAFCCQTQTRTGPPENHTMCHLLCFLLAATQSKEKPREKVYTVIGRVNLPHHGLVESAMRVTLTDRVGGGYTELSVHTGATLSTGGASQASALDPHSLHMYPFLFRRDESTGAIVEILHHPQETPHGLGTKRALAASHQLLVGDWPALAAQIEEPRVWRTPEATVHGTARAQYTVRRALGRLRRRALV